MQTVSRRVFGATALALIVTTTTVWAQQAPPLRVRGTIEKVDGDTLTVKTRAGKTATVKLAPDARVAAMLKATLADIKPGSFIGVTAMPRRMAASATGSYFCRISEGGSGAALAGTGSPAP
jgi:hypothetical protein